MKITQVIAELEHIKEQHGDIDCCLEEVQHDKPRDAPDHIIAYSSFFIVPEEYTPEDGGWTVNIRSWPY